MRLWHYEMLPYIPKSQLIAQWRELNSIFKNKPKHILINYVYEYEDDNLRIYMLMVAKEMIKRGIKINSRSTNNVFDYFPEYKENPNLLLQHINDIEWVQSVTGIDNPFPKHHTIRYLKQCYYNLQEKYDRGQKDFYDYHYEYLSKFYVDKLRSVKND